MGRQRQFAAFINSSRSSARLCWPGRASHERPLSVAALTHRRICVGTRYRVERPSHSPPHRPVRPCERPPQGSQRRFAHETQVGQHLPTAALVREHPLGHLVRDERQHHRVLTRLPVGGIGHVALRGQLQRIDVQRLVMVATPGYVSQHGTPARLEDLSGHKAMAFACPAADAAGLGNCARVATRWRCRRCTPFG